MLKLHYGLKIFLTVSLILCSKSVCADELNFHCLSRDQREVIATCFLENEACHRQIAAMPDSYKESDWQMYWLAVAYGIVGGFVISQSFTR